jgi:hypothetical protein
MHIKLCVIKRFVRIYPIIFIALGVNPIWAGNYTFGDVDITFDSTFSYGSSWRLEERDLSNNIGKSNNITNGFDFTDYHPLLNAVPDNQTLWAGEGSYSTNGDNGNLNYDDGEAFSSMLKGSHDLNVQYENIGLFVRGMYFYDFEMNDGDRPWINAVSNVQNDPCRDKKASEQLCKDIRLLDAFVYGDFDIDDMPLTVRIGQQIISWGESTLISHGISELNPVDIARLNAPGSELKEAFIPFGAVWASLGITESFNLEMFYQYSWEKTVIPAQGSYFSTNDIAGDGGHYNNVQLGFANIPDIDLDFLIESLNGFRQAALNGDISTDNLAGAYISAFPTQITLREKQANNEPSDGGQYGLRLSWYLGELDDTELSLYYMNYHSRRPIFSGLAADFSNASLSTDLNHILTNPITEKNYTVLQAFSRVELDYVEDIQLLGLSFNTSINETSLAGEISYRHNEPLQIDDVELLYAAMPQQLANAGIQPSLNGLSQAPIVQSGEKVVGYILADTLQAQLTFTHLFTPILGSSQFVGLLEVGGVYIDDMPDKNILRLNGSGTDRSGDIILRVNGEEIQGDALEQAFQNGIETNPFPDAFSWGYRIVSQLDYNNVFAGVNMSPRVVFSHDVSGITPDPLFLFVEERKSISLGINFDYQSRWDAEITYNGFWGGVGTTNLIADRDYLSFSIKYSI